MSREHLLFLLIEHTFVGALTSSVITRTNVPPSVHQRLNELMEPIAFVPMVFMIPDAMLIPQDIAAISTRVKVRPCPTSAREAIYNAVLAEISQGIMEFMYDLVYLRLPEQPVNTIAML